MISIPEHLCLFLAQRGKKNFGERGPLQELEEGLPSVPYLLVFFSHRAVRGKIEGIIVVMLCERRHGQYGEGLLPTRLPKSFYVYIYR